MWKTLYRQDGKKKGRKNQMKQLFDASPAHAADRARLTLCLPVFCIGVLLAGAGVLGNAAPFGIAFAALFTGSLLYAAFFGGLAGYLLFGTVGDNLAYLIGLALCVLLRVMTRPVEPRREPPYLPVLSSAVGMAGGGLLASFLIWRTPGAALIYLFQAVICAGITYFCRIAWDAVSSGRSLPQFTLPEQVSAAVALLLLLLAASAVEFSAFRPAVILWVAFVLSLSYRRGMAAGAAAAIAAAAVLTLRNSELALSYSVIAAALAAAGLFFPIGRFAGVAVLLLTAFCGGAVLSFPAELPSLLVHALAGGIVFLLLPQRFFTLWFGQPPVRDAAQSAGAGYGARLGFAAQTLEGLRETVENASAMIPDSAAERAEIFRQTSRGCGDCLKKKNCWDTRREPSRQAMLDALGVLSAEGLMETATLPDFYRAECRAPDRLADSYTAAYRAYLRHAESDRRQEEVRSLTLTQLSGVADMLRQVGEDMGHIAAYDAERAAAAREVFYQHGVIPDAVNCLIDRTGRTHLEIYLRAAPAGQEHLTGELSDLLGVPFDRPQVQSAGKTVRLCYFEKARFVAEVCRLQSAADGNCCGDAATAFGDPAGQYHLLLADGMGTGPAAAVDAEVCCRFLSDLIGAGFGYEAARKLLYAAISVRDGGEAAVTVDAVTVDLYNGHTVFHKAGAATSYLCRGQKCYRISTDTLPIGILSDAGYEQKTATLRDGDLLLMVSDGMLSFGDAWLTDELCRLREEPVKEIAEALLEGAARRSEGGRSDDRTVLLCRLREDS